MKNLFLEIWNEWAKTFENHGLDPWYQNADRSTAIKNLTVEIVWGILLPFALISAYWIIWPSKVFSNRVSTILKK